MTVIPATVTKELQTANEAIEDAARHPSDPHQDLDRARAAIERAIALIQHLRCEASTQLDKL